MKRHGVRLGKSNISYWTRGIHSPYNGVHIPSAEFLKPSRELAYVIGVVAGDGYVLRRSRPRKSYNDVFIGLKVKDLEFAEEFSRCLAVVLNRPAPRPRRSERGFVVQLRCKALYELLRKPFDMEKLRRFIEHNRECKSMFLRGFFDSEGCVAENGYITVHNTDISLLRYAKQLLDSLEIETTGPHLQAKRGRVLKDPRGRTYKRKKNVYRLYVPSKFRLKFYQYIGFTIRRKQQRLEDFLIRTGRLSLQPNTPLSIPQQHHLNIKCAPAGI
ncbi:MAG: LAGLIDADG family homing endonuclease [Candidatus Caldarchaeum sp.]